jgi:hypothetical protein
MTMQGWADRKTNETTKRKDGFWMQRKVCLILVVLTFLATHAPAQVAAIQSFGKAEFYRPSGTETEKLRGSVQINSQAEVLQFVGDSQNEPVLNLSFKQLKKLMYQKSSKPRYGAAVFVDPLFLLSRSKRHWLTIEYVDGDQTKTALIRLDKGNYNKAIKAIEAATGLKVEYSPEID